MQRQKIPIFNYFEDNWNTIVWKKIDYLTTIGLTPWYMQKEKYNENIRH